MRYVCSKVALYNKEQAYRLYMATALQYIAENTAKQVPEGKYLGISYQDMINPPKDTDVDAMDVVSDIVERAGLELIDL